MITITAPSSLRMDADHTYWLEGRPLISVTTALKEAGLIDTAFFTEPAAARGTYVHHACDLVDDRNLGECLPEMAGYVSAYQQFVDEADPAWQMREHMVCDPIYGYAGTLDRAGYLNGTWTVLDIKTGPPAPWHGLQLAAYGRLALSPGALLPPHRCDLYLSDTGTYRLEPHERRAMRADEQLFLAALAVAKFRRQHGYSRR